MIPSKISAMAECRLPEDLLLCILTRLPVKSLCRFKCVCKSWFSLFSTSDFVARHRFVTASNPENHSLAIFIPSFTKADFFFNANSNIVQAVEVKHQSRTLELVGCCNGLVGLVCRYLYRIILWNPATHQWKFFCHRDGLDSIFTGTNSVGMGFDSATNDVVLCIAGVSRCLRGTPNDEDFRQVKADVYSANRDCWEKVESGFKFCVDRLINEAILSGVPYWRGLVKGLGDESGFSEGYMRYDVKNGVFDHIPVPRLGVNSQVTTCLVEWKDSPAVVVHSWEENNVIDVVIFDECEGEWTNMFSIGIPIARDILYCKGTEILLETPKGELLLFDSETNRTKEICDEGACCDAFGDIGAFNYIESLVHLKDMKKVMEVEGRFWI